MNYFRYNNGYFKEYEIGMKNVIHGTNENPNSSQSPCDMTYIFANVMKSLNCKLAKIRKINNRDYKIFSIQYDF